VAVSLPGARQLGDVMSGWRGLAWFWAALIMVLAIGAGIMFLLSFIIRKNDPSGGGEVAVG